MVFGLGFFRTKRVVWGWPVDSAGVSPYVRKVKTASGARAVQVVHSEHRGSKKLTHVGSAHTDEDLALLRARAREIFEGEQQSIDLGIDLTPAGIGSKQSPLAVTGERAGYLIDALTGAYRALGFDVATVHDTVFADLVMARHSCSRGRSCPRWERWQKSG